MTAVTRQSPGTPAAARHDPHVVEEAEVAIAFAIRGEGQQRAVGRPGRLDIVVVTIGNLARLTTLRHINNEEVLAHRFKEALAVALVTDAGDDLDARLFALLVRLAFLLGDRLDVNSRRKRQAVAIE